MATRTIEIEIAIQIEIETGKKNGFTGEVAETGKGNKIRESDYFLVFLFPFASHSDERWTQLICIA